MRAPMGRPNGVACGQPGPAVRASAFTGFTAFAGFVPASSSGRSGQCSAGGRQFSCHEVLPHHTIQQYRALSGPPHGRNPLCPLCWPHRLEITKPGPREQRLARAMGAALRSLQATPYRDSKMANTLLELKMCVSTNWLHSSLAPSASIAPSNAHQLSTSCCPASSTCCSDVDRHRS